MRKTGDASHVGSELVIDELGSPVMCFVAEIIWKWAWPFPASVSGMPHWGGFSISVSWDMIWKYMEHPSQNI